MRTKLYDQRVQLTQHEVARLLGITRSAVDRAERRALEKFRRDPALRRLARELGLLGDRT